MDICNTMSLYSSNNSNKLGGRILLLVKGQRFNTVSLLWRMVSLRWVKRSNVQYPG